MQEYLGAALVVGIDNYKEDAVSNLNNACSDAAAIADVMQRLRYDTQLLRDITRTEFFTALEDFYKRAHLYNCGVFYFAGHGIEIGGENYLMTVEANIDSENALRYTSFSLQEIVSQMHKHTDTSILIIDACRDNPIAGTRSLGSMNLAPVHAPKGTIIAFSTSPGERAKDGGFEGHGVYAGAILQHIATEHQPIEDFFKQVRTTVSAMTMGKQTSWEHTSLIGDFCFNHGQLMFSADLGYSHKAVQDRYFEWEKSKAREIIHGLHSCDWYKQNEAVIKLRATREQFDPNDLFVIGRNILQSSHGGANESVKFIHNKDLVARFATSDGENHLLNGILFEIYFDSKGEYRGSNLKSHTELDTLCDYMIDPRFVKSFELISKLLNRRGLLFVPSPNPQPVNINVLLKEGKLSANPWREEEETVFEIRSIKVDATELLVELKVMDVFAAPVNSYPLKHSYTKETLAEDLSYKLNVPRKYLNLILNLEPADHQIVVSDKYGLKQT